MTTSVVLQGLTGNPTPKHHSIGKNGSFWMPKDSPDIKNSNFSNSKSNKGNSNTTSKTNNSHQPAKVAPGNASNNSKLSFERTILSEESKISPKLNLLKKTTIRQKSNFHGKSLVNSNLSQVPKFAKSVKGTVLNSRLIVPVPVTKEPLKTAIAHELTHKPVRRDNGSQDQEEKNKHHGAKNAKSSLVINTKHNDTSIQEISVNSFSPTDTALVVKLVSLIGKSVSPRVAYTNKFAKKVVRFAIDLPNGSKLGVRLEKNDEGVSLCFIAPDEKTQDLLNFCQNRIKEKVDSDQGTQLKVHIFSNYQEMDNYFLKAA
jgi:hypothetical protein